MKKIIIINIKYLFTVVVLSIACNISIAQDNIKTYQGIFSNLKQFTLKNGLTVYLDEDHSKPEVQGMVVVKAGSKNDPDDGTQSDKTLEAIDVFSGMLKQMPEKPERLENIKSYLMQAIFTNRPYFRNMSETITYWKNKGYTEDPAKSKFEAFSKLTFNDITNFYKQYISNRPITISIVGDKRKIDLKKLEKYGKIAELKQSDLFRK
ncbi:MAG: hypothetical protein Q8880_06410 [Bacteroidota bacterium]|nr:hypothetical protein [Bacteroidota bacterium]